MILDFRNILICSKFAIWLSRPISSKPTVADEASFPDVKPLVRDSSRFRVSEPNG